MNEPLQPGVALSHYRVISKLGAGGMGEVYLAEDTLLDRKVAIKLLPPDSFADEQAIRRLQREAKAAAKLDHPNICSIYEVAEMDGRSFIVMQYVEGETLAAIIERRQLDIGATLNFAAQIADALDEAHAHGIIHRDIKPANIMITGRRQAKLMDFGLAKTVAQPSLTKTEAETASLLTDPQTIIGTLPYMSPEQMRGEGLDARTDIFSFGAVLYEMISGRRPFDAESAADTSLAILTREPPPLARYARELPAELERIISKALRKDRENRYQTAKDLSIDLRELKQEIDLEAKLERSSGQDIRKRTGTTTRPDPAGATTESTERTVSDDALVIPPATSSTKIVLSEIRRHKLAVSLTIAGLLIAAVVTYLLLNREPALTDKDTILLADFDNRTGDAVFEGTLEQGLAVQLQQSPFLSLFPGERVRQALRLMGRAADEPVTAQIAREICIRHNLKAFIAGSIAALGSNYVITLEAINGQSGETLAREQVEAESREQVLKSLSQVAMRLRQKLGESLSSLQSFDRSLEDATTSNLEAFKAYSLGVENAIRGRLREAIPFYERAVELDPKFAYAYSLLSVALAATGRPGQAAESAERAYTLRDRVSEYEKLRITSFYHNNVTGDLNKRIEVLMLQKQIHPREWAGPSDLAGTYNQIGQFEQAVIEARASIRLNPNFAPSHRNVALGLLRLNRFAEAKDALDQALSQDLDRTLFHSYLYQLAFIDRDATGMQQQIDWVSGRSDEHLALDWQAQSTAFDGEWRKSQEFSRRAIDLSARSDLRELAAKYASEQALRGASLGDCRRAKSDATKGLDVGRGRASVPPAALALAMCGETNQVKSLVDELSRKYSLHTLINSIWLPVIRATLELEAGNATKAIQVLEGTTRYEGAAEFWPQYVRGQAYLRLNSGNEAAIEFRKILEHRGHAPLSTLYPLAQLGLARAFAITGDNANSRKAYDGFFDLWKAADSDTPVFQQARREYEKIR